MLVIADSSPLIVLIKIRLIDILPKLFDQIVIPPEISAELCRPERPPAVRDFAAMPPAWLKVQAPAAVENIPKLHAGELAAISLVRELKADLLLIDETRGRQAAIARDIRVTGTVGVLELAAIQNLVDLGDAFDRIKQTDFWISHDLLDARLKLHQGRSSP